MPLRPHPIDDAIRVRFPVEGPELIAKEFSRSTGYVYARARALGVTRDRSLRLPQGFVEALVARYPIEGAQLLAKEFDLSPQKVTYEARIRDLRVLDMTKVTEIRVEAKRDDLSRALLKAVKEGYAERGGKAIARELKVSSQRVGKVAKRLGIKSLHWKERKVQTRIFLNKNCRWDAFEALDTPESLYFYGLLWADGCVYNKTGNYLALSLTEPEWHLLYDFQEFMGCDKNHISEPYKNRKKKHQWQRRFVIGNVRLINSLISKGIVPNKSHVDPSIPSEVMENKFFRHMVRGWLDGDGFISYGKTEKRTYPRVGWIGGQKALNQLCTHMHEEIKIGYKIPYNKHPKLNAKTWTVVWTSWEDERIILEWMHQEGGIYAPRKHSQPLVQLVEHGSSMPVTYKARYIAPFVENSALGIIGYNSPRWHPITQPGSH